MTFAEYCQQNSDAIYNAILGYLPVKEPREHYSMVRDYTERRGKYARPNLALLWAELFDANKKSVFSYACGIQMAEDWFLMHDDWMDQNELRRRKPSAHKLYGDVFAINAGDAMHAAMWKMVHDDSLQTPPNPLLGVPDVGLPLSGEEYAIKHRLFDKFYNIIMVTIEGQYYDLKLAREKDITKFTLEDYWQSIHAKAAYYSVYGPMQLGAIAAGKSDDEVNAIKEYGEKIGRAFQVKDDILDCTSTEEMLGKTIGNDVLEGTKTAILWHFVQNSSTEDLEFVKNIYAKDRAQKTAKEIKNVLELFQKTDSIAYAEQLVDNLAKEAMTEFERQTSSLPESEIKDTARNAIRSMATREK
jgi:geranylgeranyl diphosphate synthase type II